MELKRVTGGASFLCSRSDANERAAGATLASALVNGRASRLRRGHRAREAPADEFQRSGRRLRKPRLGRLGRRRLRRQVVQQRDDRGAAPEVDRRVVQLGQQREAVLRQVEQAVEPLDDVELPQRPVEVERAGVDARRLDAELAPVARLRQGDVADVVLEVEVLVLHPVRIVEPERDAAKLLAEDRRAVQPALHEREEALELQPAGGRGRRVVDLDQADVRVGMGTFRGEEEGVVPAELAHVDGFLQRPACAAVSRIRLSPTAAVHGPAVQQRA